MLEQLKYKNHMNEVFEFGKEGIYVNTSELHDFEWRVTKKNNRISVLDYTVSKRKLPVTILCESEEAGIRARNKLFEIAEKDVLAMQYGRIIIGDYYFKCFITKAEKSDYLVSKRYMTLKLTLTTDMPYWVRETPYVFGHGAGSLNEYLDYPFDMPFDYRSEVSMDTVNNTGIVGTNFRLIIYGTAINPAIYIGDHEYSVNCEVNEGEYLVVDSTSKEIYLVGQTGTKTNKFNDRNRDSYIFEKIPSGVNTVSWDGEFGFDIILYEERSEPKWT